MRIASTNPSRNYEPIGEIEASSDKDGANALAKARVAQPKWAALTQAERNKAIESFIIVCNEHAEEIATVISTEMGKPIKLSRLDIQESADYFHGFMEIAGQALQPQVVFEDAKQVHTQIREPLGVLACITPWNFPIFNIPFQFGEALLAGNVVLYKPSEEIIVFAKLVEKLVKESDIPEGVLTVLYGDGKVGEQLVQLPVDGILFTGSTRTGQRITELAAKRSVRALTEMGGSSPGIVFEDADGKVVLEPEDISVGRVAVVEDPFGNRLTLVDLSKGRYEADGSKNVTGVSKDV
jgi:acyl-CoA reductase-like NAD-dependent aldehyde dehydrogenase